jgi:hypothetical protein
MCAFICKKMSASLLVHLFMVVSYLADCRAEHTDSPAAEALAVEEAGLMWEEVPLAEVVHSTPEAGASPLLAQERTSGRMSALRIRGRVNKGARMELGTAERGCVVGIGEL